jgi:hypothetical protein
MDYNDLQEEFFCSKQNFIYVELQLVI